MLKHAKKWNEMKQKQRLLSSIDWSIFINLNRERDRKRLMICQKNL
mgnify:CR=1 FL=1